MAEKLIFTFPGQGSFDPRLLANLYGSENALRRLFHVVDAVAGDMLRIPFLRMVLAESGGTKHSDLDTCPDLDQLGIYLANYAAAQLWLRRGILPDLLMGHSFGEFAALAIAGVYSFEDGAKIVCQRILSLREWAAPGKMAAVMAPHQQVAAVLKEHAESCFVAVINHAGQTVVSGPESALQELRERFARQGVMLKLLQSRYPFHSPLLSESGRAFGIALRSYSFARAQYPVFSGTEQKLLGQDVDLADALCRQLISPLDFDAGVRGFASQGYLRFLECGAGAIVTKLVGSILKAENRLQKWATFANSEDVSGQIRKVELELAGQKSLPESASPAPATPVLSSEMPPVASPEPEPTPFEPIAIVAMGCVFPGGANDPEKFWTNLSAGVSGIVDLTQIDPHAKEDFVAGKADGSSPQIVSDKTYTLLNGSILEIAFDKSLLGEYYSEADFYLLTKGQKILALAMAQVRLRQADQADGLRRQCILGSTADGSAELDEAHFSASVRDVLHQLEEPVRTKDAFAGLLSTALPGWKHKPEELTPHKLCAAVAQKVLGTSADCTYLVDSACSSSLYSLALGARALRTGEADVVYAGGVFAPGPANNNLFAQFRGLTAHESRPFDAQADGVVFGDGAGVVALKRLSDAIDHGDQILGVIRSEGFSSDGKSPSINVPQSHGQAMAIRAAYERAALDTKSVQFVEAHATATPVGDAVEFKALREALTPPDGAPRPLGSVKALIGHTGWTSGVASVIKICKALEHRRIPKQFCYASPNPSIELANSGFTIPLQETDWPTNSGGLPRRAGLNGFGFGGTNAHFVIEEYLEGYHKSLAARFRGKTTRPEQVVIVAAEGLFPEGTDAFDRSKLRMPNKRMVLPDVAEHMDASQYLATMAAEKIADTIPVSATGGNLRIGVALGVESKTERGVRANERVFLDRLSRIARTCGASQDVLTSVRKAIVAKVIPSGPYTLPGLMPNVAASRITHTFNWHGPNVVIDRGTGSLVQALDAGIKFVRAGDCEIALAGGVNAWTGHHRDAKEAVALVAVASAETAIKHKLPILARIQFNDPPPGVRKVVLNSGDESRRGATGAAELLEAIRGVADQSIVTSLVWNGKALMTLVPADETKRNVPVEAMRSTEVHPAISPGSHAYVQGTPITNYTHVLMESPALLTEALASNRSYLFLTDQPDSWRKFELEASLRNLKYSVATPSHVSIPGTYKIDVATEQSLTEGLAQLRRNADFDTIVAVKQLAGCHDEDLLRSDFTETRGLLDLLFGVCKQRYDDISARRCSVSTICLGALRSGELDAYTGLFSGFVKSLARELPGAKCKAISTNETQLGEMLERAAAELEAKDGNTEVAYLRGRRLHNVLTESQPLHHKGAPWVRRDSVVIATGGGRGVTAVLVEHVLQAYGCTVIALGRTDAETLPTALREMDEAAFQRYESEFYKEQLAADRSKKIQDLKKLYEGYQASHELRSVIRRCRALPGRFEYIQCDITDAAAIETVVGRVLSQYGRLDMVLHGAGVQISKIVPRKTLADFQRILSTKLASLGHLYRACQARGILNTVNFHILTSAFSYLGNDGQPDYGSANEAMNRLAARLNLVYSGSYWSSLAWLGWAGIGMTRGTEYAALAASRRLRGVTREEGQRIFADAISGPPAAPINIILADGEVAFYHPEIREGALTGPSRNEGVVEWPVSPTTMPFLFDHLVRGVPTVPGSFIIAMAADAARKLLPDLKIIQFERTRFLRLVRAYEGSPGRVRAISKVVDRNGDEHVVQVQIVMDFVHKNGSVLRKDLLHTEIYVRMSPTVPQPSGSNGYTNGAGGLRLPDPYVMQGSPVRLNGVFRAMKEIVVGPTTRHATYNLNGHAPYGSEFDYMIPNVILVDAFWRFGTVQSNQSGKLSVYVPEKCDAMKVFFDYGDFDAEVLRKPVTFHGANPRTDGESLHVGPIDAYDAQGRILLRVEGGLCRKFGEIEVA
jgi:acyl transferase domain-containing protein/NAD(P)-dependent dehydrogenase (short-subunit alcohol dehydrogenase family)